MASNSTKKLNFNVSTPADLTVHLKESLRHLQMPDLKLCILLHRCNPKWNKEQLSTFYEILYNSWLAGECQGGIGVSECNAEQLEHLVAHYPVHIYEGAWNPGCRRMERNGILPIVRKNGIKVLTYTSIIRGFCNPDIAKIDLSMDTMEIQKEVFKLLNIENNSFENTVGFYATDVIVENLRIIKDF